MNEYNTYQEAKIENPDSEIYHFKHKNVDGDSFFFTVDDEKNLVAINGVIFKCKPADYCMTLADFFDAGHKLVMGDVYESMLGGIFNVLSEISANERIDSDDQRYILRAKALEKKEWKNGDEIEIYTDDAEWVEARYVAFDGGMGYHVTFSDSGLGYSLYSEIRELESEVDKAKREALEIIDSGNFDVTHGEIVAILDELSSAGMLKSRGDK